ncbi:MAG: dihydroxyacetone kinase phosphoryl donor subunit DhaM [Corynebacterium sp.]|nr:dihydroxyacetone kinase phosphoryl donor subunit DhaM [Corynebacterium sp.]
MSEISVGIVIVSHSAQLAAGVVELAQEMAPDVPLRAAGGRDDGGIGTSYDRIEQAVAALRALDVSVGIYTDLGSATMTAEMVVDMAGDPEVQLIDAPLVEGAIAGAVAAQQGRTLPQLTNTTVSTDSTGARYERTVHIADPVGLHARPAARVAELAADNPTIELNGQAADSALVIMSLALREGDPVTISGVAKDAPIVDQIADFLATTP